MDENEWLRVCDLPVFDTNPDFPQALRIIERHGLEEHFARFMGAQLGNLELHVIDVSTDLKGNELVLVSHPDAVYENVLSSKVAGGEPLAGNAILLLIEPESGTILDLKPEYLEEILGPVCHWDPYVFHADHPDLLRCLKTLDLYWDEEP